MLRPVLRLVLVAGLVATGAACRGDSSARVVESAPPKPAATIPTPAPPVRPAGVPPATPVSLAAFATVPKVAVYDAPDSTNVKVVLGNPTIEKVQLAMFVTDRRGDWLLARLPMRPNGSEGWIRAADVQLQPTTTRIAIDVSERRLQVLDQADAVIFEAPVAVGKDSTPTALGRFFLDVWLPNPGRPYGEFLLSISGFSDVLKTFGGGRGQLAVHGWADPSVVGKNVSNGCVRMRNADVARVAALAPLGTPIEIIA